MSVHAPRYLPWLTELCRKNGVWPESDFRPTGKIRFLTSHPGYPNLIVEGTTPRYSRKSPDARKNSTCTIPRVQYDAALKEQLEKDPDLMSTKTFVTCDGCDQSIDHADAEYRRWNLVAIQLKRCAGWTPTGLNTDDDLALDLCENCQHRLAGQSDPRKWVRSPTERGFTPPPR